MKASHYGEAVYVPMSVDPWGNPIASFANIHLQQDEECPEPTLFVGSGEAEVGLGRLRLREAERVAHVLLELVKQARGRH